MTEQSAEVRVIYKQDGFDQPMTVTTLPGGVLRFFQEARQDGEIEWIRLERRIVEPWSVIEEWTRS